MQTVVKQLVNEDGEVVPVDEQVWHAVRDFAGDNALVCTGEYTSFGSGHGTYESKKMHTGITCKDCRAVISAFHKLKL
ncbi:MAG: hypothetical protein HRU18_06880 [Pseudoalteromonas sp.]|uniref:hypothetical protein n=1 Tax=Pseudoalteromonas sp. TaxID=53249 RepID=UPI001DF1F1D0|nr:hypothetical protein [Pseudoalteromonas sp.]NRA77915.1 hypothetical protein [Pseudoalteromonas sp.]